MTKNWEELKERIHQLYIVENLTLAETRQTLLDEGAERFGERALKQKLQTWKFRKYNKGDDQTSAHTRAMSSSELPAPNSIPVRSPSTRQTRSSNSHMISSPPQPDRRAMRETTPQTGTDSSQSRPLSMYTDITSWPGSNVDGVQGHFTADGRRFTLEQPQSPPNRNSFTSPGPVYFGIPEVPFGGQAFSSNTLNNLSYPLQSWHQSEDPFMPRETYPDFQVTTPGYSNFPLPMVEDSEMLDTDAQGEDDPEYNCEHNHAHGLDSVNEGPENVLAHCWYDGYVNLNSESSSAAVTCPFSNTLIFCPDCKISVNRREILDHWSDHYGIMNDTSGQTNDALFYCPEKECVSSPLVPRHQVFEHWNRHGWIQFQPTPENPDTWRS